MSDEGIAIEDDFADDDFVEVSGIVGADDPKNERPKRDSLYDFEGEPVSRTKAKVTSAANLEVNDGIYRVDDTVKLVVECRVVGVDHKVASDGKIERVHTFKAIDSLMIDWNIDIDDLRDGLAP